MANQYFRILYFLFIILFTNCKKNSVTPDTTPPAADATVSVDFSGVPSAAKSMAGFLHGMSTSQPADNWITPLSPAYWRAGTLMNGIYPRINAFGAKPILAISDVYRYPGDNVSGWKQPFGDYTAWESFVENIYTQASATSSSFIYEIWNEPNSSYFWTGTRQQFFETFKRAHDKIRSLPGGTGAKIAGPALNGLDTAFLRQFIDYCSINNVRVDVLTWHEFRSTATLENLESNLLAIRNAFIINPVYSVAGIKEIYLDEMVGESEQFVPASLLGYFSGLEKGKADAACRACWNESTGINNCFNNTLGGLLTPNTFQPRAAWWSYRFYNLSVKNRVSSTTTKPNLISFASTSSENANQLQVLLGYYGSGDSSISVNLDLKKITSVSHLAGKTSVQVKVLKIPNTGEQSLLQPVMVSETTATVNNGGIKVHLSGFKMKEGMVVQVY